LDLNITIICFWHLLVRIGDIDGGDTFKNVIRAAGTRSFMKAEVKIEGSD